MSLNCIAHLVLSIVEYRDRVLKGFSGAMDFEEVAKTRTHNICIMTWHTWPTTLRRHLCHYIKSHYCHSCTMLVLGYVCNVTRDTPSCDFITKWVNNNKQRKEINHLVDL